MMAKQTGVVKRKAVLIDVDYRIKDNKTVVRLLLKGKRFFRLYDHYEPYFYLDAPKGAEKEIMEMKVARQGQGGGPTRLERVKMSMLGHEKEIWKVYCERPYDVPHVSGAMKHTWHTRTTFLSGGDT